jgi:CheY-like chemotaxis protein
MRVVGSAQADCCRARSVRHLIDLLRVPRMSAATREPKRVLVVNDTEEILDLFQTILEGMGHQMTGWSFSPDDLAKVTDVKPDLVILDVLAGPTELQGWALLQKMRMSPETEDIPVLICSAATSWVREQEGWLAANAVKVVLKPFKVKDLERAIDRALALPEITVDRNRRGMRPVKRQEEAEVEG